MKTYVGLLLLGLLTIYGPVALASEPRPVMITGIAEVIDGDTLEIGPIRIRLHGIDAAEVGQRCEAKGGGTWRCGASATNRMRELVGRRPISCEALETDLYGRIVARCDVEGVDLSQQLMKEGLAWAFLKYSTDYLTEQQEAETKRIGVWQAHTQTPWEYREDRWARAEAASPDGCPIKGNINTRTGDQIYHTPWSPNYASTQIDEADGERWFCTEAEAVAAGWRPRQP